MRNSVVIPQLLYLISLRVAIAVSNEAVQLTSHDPVMAEADFQRTNSEKNTSGFRENENFLT